jgi:hypothetical protein
MYMGREQTVERARRRYRLGGKMVWLLGSQWSHCMMIPLWELVDALVKKLRGMCTIGWFLNHKGMALLQK